MFQDGQQEGLLVDDEPVLDRESERDNVPQLCVRHAREDRQAASLPIGLKSHGLADHLEILVQVAAGFGLGQHVASGPGLVLQVQLDVPFKSVLDGQVGVGADHIRVLARASSKTSISWRVMGIMVPTDS